MSVPQLEQFPDYSHPATRLPPQLPAPGSFDEKILHAFQKAARNNPIVAASIGAHRAGVLTEHQALQLAIVNLVECYDKLMKLSADAMMNSQSITVVSPATAPQPKESDGLDEFTDKIPDRPGYWELQCGETENKPELIVISGRAGILMAECPHIGACPIDCYHNGLTCAKWRVCKKSGEDWAKYFGTRIIDPYGWMSDETSMSKPITVEDFASRWGESGYSIEYRQDGKSKTHLLDEILRSLR